MALASNCVSPVFCDWLDVTAPVGEEYRLRSDLGAILCACGAEKLTDDLYGVGGGKAKLGCMRGVFRVSLSGAVIRVLVIQGQWGSLLSALGEGPHRVTRLDAAVDLDQDGAESIAQLQAMHPRGEVRLSQRPVKVTELLQTRPDGLKTGTWYAGHRSGAEITCRVYDKAQQLFDTKGELCPPRTRAELTVRKGCTLRDAYEPARVFWHYMAPAILKRPESVPEWSSGWGEGWTMERVELLPAVRLKRRIEDSPELAALIELADSIGTDGRDFALRLIRERFDRDSRSGSLPGFDCGLASGGS